MPVINRGPSPQILSTYVFFDGGQMRSGLSDMGVAWQDVNLRQVAEIAINSVGRTWQGGNLTVSRVFIYDAVADNADPSTDAVERWLRRNDDLPDVHVRRGRLVGSPLRQKGVDVQLAVDALSFAANGIIDAAILVAGDADFAPVVEAIREKGVLVGVCAFKAKLSERLRQLADRTGILPDETQAWAGWSLPPSV